MQLKAGISILGVIDDYGEKNSSKGKRFSFLQGWEGEGEDESQRGIFGDSNMANKSVVWRGKPQAHRCQARRHDVKYGAADFQLWGKCRSLQRWGLSICFLFYIYPLKSPQGGFLVRIRQVLFMNGQMFFSIGLAKSERKWEDTF